MKQESALASLPVIVVTSEANSDLVIEVMRLGAFDHLSLPLSLDELSQAIERGVFARSCVLSN
ncbi:hypothetical protein KF707_21785 [Candidatus Obscuribacterales bacterium]|nr:hypothetical protein [Candidatus Obscuribacterales bacterium]MBX3138873.1 hypothetical protein [Candidatus Obscuribacterales bacterium]MBX3152657.1 hypothetical protein [Candidatus Obscuribacterales bacterium]